MPGENILQSVQKIASALYRLDALTDEVHTLRADVNARLDQHDLQIGDLQQ